MAVILVVTSTPPLVEGGHTVIARALCQALCEAGHRAEVVTTPANRFGRQGAAYLANWLTDVGQTGDGTPVDRVITLRFPSFAVRHPHQVCWLNHTMREYYDLWDHFSAQLSPQGRLKELTRRTLIRAADTYCFKHHVERLFAISRNVQRRLKQFNGLGSTVLHPPPPPRPYRCDVYGDYLFFTSRLTPLKRADLFLRALAEPAARSIRAVVAGTGEQWRDLQRLARELDLESRVQFVGHADDETLAHHLACCRGVVFVPVNEDYGFVTVEAFASGKPVITATDSGGPLEFVRDGETGLVVAPEPAALAVACARLMDSPSDAQRMGQAGYRSIADLTWEKTVAALTLGARGNSVSPT
jgi:glycosyltransferase involved in cell wall biosynthesis